MEKEIEIRMHVPEESSTGNYSVIQLSDFTYKLTNNDPFNETLSYGTIIEVDSVIKEEDGRKVYTFKSVQKESDFSINVIGLPSELDETGLRIVGKMITDEGGFWEVIFGGMGSWNDVGFKDKNVEKLYDELSEELYANLNGSYACIANSFLPE